MKKDKKKILFTMFLRLLNIVVYNIIYKMFKMF